MAKKKVVTKEKVETSQLVGDRKGLGDYVEPVQVPVEAPAVVLAKPAADPEMLKLLKDLADFCVPDPQNYRRAVKGAAARNEAYALLEKC